MRRFVMAMSALVLTIVPAGTASAVSESASCAGSGFSDHAQAHEMRAVIHD
jgi:hypothetical protein